MSIAGHVSRAMLSRYSHVRMEAKRRALDDIAARQRTADEKRKEKPKARSRLRRRIRRWFSDHTSGKHFLIREMRQMARSPLCTSGAFLPERR